MAAAPQVSIAFQGLLAALAGEHERETHALREECARLHQLLAERTLQLDACKAELRSVQEAAASASEAAAPAPLLVFDDLAEAIHEVRPDVAPFRARTAAWDDAETPEKVASAARRFRPEESPMDPVEPQEQLAVPIRLLTATQAVLGLAGSEALAATPQPNRARATSWAARYADPVLEESDFGEVVVTPQPRSVAAPGDEQAWQPSEEQLFAELRRPQPRRARPRSSGGGRAVRQRTETARPRSSGLRV